MEIKEKVYVYCNQLEIFIDRKINILNMNISYNMN